jgi:hypothetical protein
MVFALSAATASAVEPCDGVDRRLDAGRREQFSALIAQAIKTPHTAEQITVSRFMQSGRWSAAWAGAKDLEPGVFFFETSGGGQRFADVWGGWAVPADRPQLVKWAHGLGKDVPNNLATCFAYTVTAGH